MNKKINKSFIIILLVAILFIVITTLTACKNKNNSENIKQDIKIENNKDDSVTENKEDEKLKNADRTTQIIVIDDIKYELNEAKNARRVIGFEKDDKKKIVNILDEVAGLPVNEIADSAFIRKNDIVDGYFIPDPLYGAKIIIPDTVVRIGKEAFKYRQFSEITLPKKLDIIDEKAFNGCHSVKKYTFIL